MTETQRLKTAEAMAKSEHNRYQALRNAREWYRRWLNSLRKDAPNFRLLAMAQDEAKRGNLPFENVVAGV